MATVIWLSVGIVTPLILIVGWSLCAAAKRGDRQMEECEFTHYWAERRS